MSDKSEASVIGSLPRSRPQRRSDKRGPQREPAAASAEPPTRPTRPKAAAKPNAAARPRATARPKTAAGTYRAEAPNQDAGNTSLPDGTELLATVVKATAELAEIGLTLGARALRTAVSRLPRP